MHALALPSHCPHTSISLPPSPSYRPSNRAKHSDVDTAPDDASLHAARAAIAAEIRAAGVDAAQLHPSLIPAAKYTPQFPSSLEHEHARLAADPSSRLSAIDLARYDELDAPENTHPTSDEERPEVLPRDVPPVPAEVARVLAIRSA